MEEKEILVRKEESCKHTPKFGRGTWGNHESKVDSVQVKVKAMTSLRGWTIAMGFFLVVNLTYFKFLLEYPSMICNSKKFHHFFKV